jgi:hypothetical protein
MAEDYEHTLKIAAKKHDITGIRVYDVREQKPDIGMVSMLDAETGETQLIILVQKQFDSITRNIIMSD